MSAENNGSIVKDGTSHEDAAGVINTIILRDEQGSQGIEESEDVIRFFDKLADGIIAAKGDGVINIKDVIHAALLAMPLYTAVRGSEQVVSEYNHATGEERDKLYNDLMSAAQKLMNAIRA